MRQSFLWKSVICITPVVLSLWSIGWAYSNDKFKKGVDLSGGTILVYEIDTRVKNPQDSDKKADDSTANLAGALAARLKDRIDPNDLYNIVIRPAGGEGRVEIILPTGGVEREKKAKAEWDALIEDMKKEFKLTTLDAPRGHIQELAEIIQQQVDERIWNEKLFNTPEARAELVDSVQKDLRPYKELRLEAKVSAENRTWKLAAAAVGTGAANPFLETAVAYSATQPAPVPPILQPLKAENFRQVVDEAKKRVGDYSKEKEIEGWFKDQAWKAMIDRLIHQKVAGTTQYKYPTLVARKANFEDISYDHVPQLIGRVQMLGNPITQAFAGAAEPLIGKDALTAGKDDPNAKEPDFLSREEAKKFIEEYYGFSLQEIEKKIQADNKSSGRGKDLTVEEVQRIKDLVSKVGSLEFRILANDKDDQAAIEAAEKLINNQENRTKLDELRYKGQPPPPPLEGDKIGGLPKAFTLELARGTKSTVTYSWVELGREERQSLGLDNAARKEPSRGENWRYLETHRNQAVKLQLPNQPNRFYLQGALFYSRPCEDRNLPEEERRKKDIEYFVLTRNPEVDPATGKKLTIDGDLLRYAKADFSGDGRPAVAFVFSPEGGKLFGSLTRKNVPSGAGDEASQIKRHLAIILDGLVITAPTINSEISTHGQISGNFNKKDVDDLARILESGKLPATLKKQPVSESTMGSTLGQDTVNKGLMAIGIAFAAVLAFMVVYYRFAGLVACVALFANLIITVGFMAGTGATFTLPGLAGLVLMLGMAVDANILIYERLREEREHGANLAMALRNGYDRALPTIIDTHLSSIFTAIVLYIVGNDQLKGFGISLTAGLVISLFTSLFMTRVIFDYWLSRGWLKKLSMFRLFAKPDFDFMAIRYYWFTATIILTILGIALFIGRLPYDLNIDFVGGTAYGGQLKVGKPQHIDGLRALVDEGRQKQMLQPEVKEIADSKGHEFEIKYKKPDGGYFSNVPRTVIFANVPPGDTPEAREAEVAKRATVLPDPSIEQVFPSLKEAQEADPYSSRFFNVRTSEKEAELVQATLDQLLQEKTASGQWESLLKKVEMNPTQLESGREFQLTFNEDGKDGKEGRPLELVFASPSFVKTLLVRELLREYKVSELKELPFLIELTGEGPTQDGRFQKMKLAFAPSSKPALDSIDIDHIKKALEKTRVEFRDRPQPERLETFDSQLAAEIQKRAMAAILLSWGAILLYLWFRFGSWTFGLAAVFCLIHDLFFTLGIIAACHYIHGTAIGNLLGIEDFKIDLTAVAALLTLVGYSVNDTIVVFDRIREVRGKNPELTPRMINDSVNQTLSRTVLASLATWLVVIVLYISGGPGVHLFAFVMVVGVVVGTYSSIYIASPLLLIFGEGARAQAAQQRQRDAERAAATLETGIQPAR